MATHPERVGSRLSPEADELVRQATDEASGLGAESVRPEHLLIALLREPVSPITVALERLRLSYERVKAVVQPSGAPEIPTGAAAPPWSRAALMVLDRADDEAAYRDAAQIKPAHLLVALDPWEESLSRVLAELRPRVRPHDFMKAARSVPGLDGE